MSADNQHGHGGQAHGSLKEYIVGLILSVVLTVIPFAMVMTGAASDSVTLAVIVVTAIAQVFVQLIFFLHMNGSSEQSWLTMTGIYSLFVVVFVIIGSLWIFDHLNHNLLMGH